VDELESNGRRGGGGGAEETFFSPPTHFPPRSITQHIMSATSTKRAALAVLQFLEQQVGEGGSIKSDDKESIEGAWTCIVLPVLSLTLAVLAVAIQCISEAFGVATDSDQDKKAYQLNKSLPAILDEVSSQSTLLAPPSMLTARFRRSLLSKQRFPRRRRSPPRTRQRLMRRRARETS
jgi:hypothetical protein